MLLVHDSDGLPLAAAFELGLANGELSLVMHSAGGAGQKGGVPRNADYAQGLELLLRRLGQLGGSLTDGYVDSARVQQLPLAQRRLVVPDKPYPIQLDSITDFEVLRKRLTGAQKAIGKSSSGNERKRIRLQLQVPGLPPTPESVDKLSLILPELSEWPPSEETEPPAPGAGSSGQGFSQDTPTKLAVEAAAMKAAREHYEGQHWKVTDVSLQKLGYDLLCERDARDWRWRSRELRNLPKAFGSRKERSLTRSLTRTRRYFSC